MPTASNLSETVKSKFLQLSGGTVTGAIAVNRADGHIYKKDASGRMMLRGGTSTATDGASIYLTGKDYSGGASTFQVRCHDGTNDKSFIAKPNGTLTWGGKNVVCVESWRSGYNWYRKYSDGFIEQGGTFGANTGSWADVTFSFPIAFSNTNYNLFVQGNWSSAECSSCLVHARSASSVTVRHANNYYSTMPSYFVAYGT